MHIAHACEMIARVVRKIAGIVVYAKEKYSYKTKK